MAGRRWGVAAAATVMAAAAAVGATAPTGAVAGRRVGARAASPMFDAVDVALATAPNFGSIAVDGSGRVWASGWGTGTAGIRRYEPDGTFTDVGTPGRDYRGPMVAAPDGTIYVATFDGIERIATDGTRSIVAGLDPYVEALAVAPDGSLWTRPESDDHLVRRSPTGKLTTVPLGAWMYGIGLAAGPDGSMYVPDPERKRLLRVSPTGQLSTVGIGHLGSDLGGVAVASDGTISLIDGPDLMTRTPAGVVTRTPLTDLGTPSALAVGADATVYVLDIATMQVTSFPRAGSGRTFGTIGVQSPYDLAVGPDGTMWVVDGDAGLLRVSSDGATTRVPVPSGGDPKAVAIGADGTRYVAMATYDDVTASGFLSIVPTSGAPQEVPLPEGEAFDLAADVDGTVYLATYDALFAWRPGGTWRTVVGEGWPSAVAVDGTGSVYYADDGTEGGRIRKLAPTGEVRTLESIGGWSGSLAVDGSGNLFTHRVQGAELAADLMVQARGGHPVAASSWKESDDDQLSTIAVGPDGSVYGTLLYGGIIRFHRSATAVPGAPIVRSTVAGSGQVTVGWTTPPTNGSPITGYSVTTLVEGVPQATVDVGADQTSATITGLADGTTSTFTVRARSGLGPGPSSWESNAVTPTSGDRHAPFARWDSLVQRQLLDFTGVGGTTATRSMPVAALIAGQATPASYVNGLRRATSFDPQVAPVIRLYLAYFGRSPDVGGYRYWLGRRRAGTTVAKVSATFAASSEFERTYGARSDGEFVDLVYANVLGRPADPSGRAYWVRRLGGGLSRGTLMANFSESSEHVGATAARVTVVELYLAMLRRPPTEAEVAEGSGRSVASLIDAIRTSPAYAATL